MDKKTFYMNFSYLLAAFIFILFMVITASEASEPEKGNPSALQNRIDFGSSYILGQSIKSGAVYLLHRKKSEIKGMLKVRQDYRQEIMEDFDLEKSAILLNELEFNSLDALD